MQAVFAATPQKDRAFVQKYIKLAGSQSLQCSPARTPQKDRAFAQKNIKLAGSQFPAMFAS